MTVALRISIVSAVAVAVSLVAQGASPGADYPTPRSLAARRAPAPPAEIQPVAATENTTPEISGSAAESTRRPQVVRIDAQEQLEPKAIAREFPSSKIIGRERDLPTPRPIARPRSSAGARVEPIPAESTRPASHEEALPSAAAPIASSKSELPTEAKSPSDRPAEALAPDPTSLRVVTKTVSTGRSLPKVRVSADATTERFDKTGLQPIATSMQPLKDNFSPTADDLKRWFTPLDQVGILPQPEPGDFPRDFSGNLFAVDDRPRRKDWPEREFNWTAAELWHKPFYFEDVPLERYGQSLNPARQAWLSGLKFYMTFPILPVKLWADPPMSRVATYGYYRMGSDNPAVRQKSILPYGYGPWGGGYWRGAGSFWEVPPSPNWATTPQ